MWILAPRGRESVHPDASCIPRPSSQDRSEGQNPRTRIFVGWGRTSSCASGSSGLKARSSILEGRRAPHFDSLRETGGTLLDGGVEDEVIHEDSRLSLGEHRVKLPDKIHEASSSSNLPAALRQAAERPSVFCEIQDVPWFRRRSARQYSARAKLRRSSALSLLASPWPTVE